MKQADILVKLVKSLSKAEKRSFRLSSNKSSDYMMLFNLIDKDGIEDPKQLRDEYGKRNCAAAFNATLNYLYNLLLDKLAVLRTGSISTFQLMSDCMKAQVLFEKSLYPAAFNILTKVKKKASELENFEILLMALRLELDYLQYLKMPNMSEKDLTEKHQDLSSTIEKLTYLNEQSKLYEIIEHRLIYIGNARSDKHIYDYNDLLNKDESLNFQASSSLEAKRRHLLFLALYHTAKGEGDKAMKTLTDLNNLISKHPHLAENPLYYIRFIHNMLDNLRDAKQYDKMPEFLENLRSKQYHSQYVTTHVAAIADLYQLIIYIDHGDFQRAGEFIKACRSFDIAGSGQLHIAFEARILLYIAITHIANKNYKQARHTLSKSMFSSKMALEFPIFRTVKLTNLIVHYKMKDFDYIIAQSRSLRREMAQKSKAFSMELLLMKIIQRSPAAFITKRQRDKLWHEIEPEIKRIKSDPFESQALYLFDFSAWLESEITRRPLKDILLENLGSNPQ